MSRPHWRIVIALVGAALGGLINRAFADAGPSFRRPAQLVISYEGQALSDPRVTIAVLDCGATAKGKSVDSMAGFAREQLPELRDCVWLWTVESTIDRPVIRPGNLASSSAIKVVLLVKEREQVFVSNAVDIHPLHNLYRLRLGADGSATLSLDQGGQPSVDWLFSVWQRGYLFALLVTCGLESLILAVWARWRRSSSVLTVVVVCLVMNMLTVTGVWGVTLVGFALSGNAWFGLVLLAVSEVAAVATEGSAYVLTRRLKLADAFQGSLVANLASFATGLCIANL